VSYIHQVDFLRVDAILSKTFNRSYNEIYGVETTFLSKSKGVFVSFLEIIMAYGKGKAQEKHDKSTWQSDVWGFHDKHQGMSMMKSITFIMRCGIIVILRRKDWNELIGHPKDRGKDSSNSGRILSNLGRMMYIELIVNLSSIYLSYLSLLYLNFIFYFY
jgi:hypothetical protein